MVDQIFRSLLISKDIEKTKKYLHSLKLREHIVPILNDLLFVSILVKNPNQNAIHPVCLINSIKNIIGDNKQNPSLTLLEFCIEFLADFELRNNDQIALDETAKDGIGLTAFLGDLEDACQHGEWETAKHLTAKTFLASDQSRGVLDSLCELALQDSKRNSLFIFHVLRAYQFQESKDDNWAYTTCVFDWVSQQTLPPAHEKHNVEPNQFIDTMIQGGDLNWFAAVTRLWDGDYVRIRSYQRELSYGLSQFADMNQPRKSGVQHWINSQNKTKYIEAAEKITLSNKSKSEITNQIVTLESVRALSRIATPEQKNILGQRLDEN